MSSYRESPRGKGPIVDEVCALLDAHIYWQHLAPRIFIHLTKLVTLIHCYDFSREKDLKLFITIEKPPFEVSLN